MRLLGAILVFILLLVSSIGAAPDEKPDEKSTGIQGKSEYGAVPEFGGPDSTGVLLRGDDVKKIPFLRFP